jgi:hypothetical protein
MGVSDAVGLVLQIVVIALVIGILEKIGTTTISGFGFDFTQVIGLVLGLALVCALIEAVAGIVQGAAKIKTIVLSKGRVEPE